MTLTARALKTHEMAVEAALTRIQKRWSKLSVQSADAETDVVAALLPLMLEIATLDTASTAAQIPEYVVAAGGPAAFFDRLGTAVRSRLAAGASTLVTALRGGTSPRLLARSQVAGIRATGTQELAAVASTVGPVEIEWHSSPSCTHQYCLNLNGTKIPFGGTFSGGFDGPPAHIGCVCRTEVIFGPAFDIRTADAKERVTDSGKSRQALTAAADGPGWLAVVAIEGLETPDHRLIEKGGLGWRTLPLPITWCSAGNGHEGDVVVGQITEMWREGDEIRARGNWDTSPTAMEARRLVDAQIIRWVSMVHDEPRAWELRQSPDGCADLGPDMPIEAIDECTVTYVVLDADIAKFAIVDHPAFPGSVIVSGDAEIPALTDRGRPAAGVADVAPVLALAACAARATPPSVWFNEPAPGTVNFSDDGQIFGYFAPDVEHISGFGRPPKGADYDSAFHLYDLVTSEGQTIKVGYVVGGVGHPNDTPRTMSVAEAQRYYAGPGSIVTAMVRVGETEHGTWMAGAVSPDLTDEERHQLRTFKFSGDWRRVKGDLRWKLVAIASGILVPGYPDALVAAGSETSLILVGV